MVSSKIFIRSFYPFLSFLYIISLLSLLVISFPSAQGLGLSGVKISPVVYVPGQIITNHYEITETNLPTQVSVSGDAEINDFVRLTEVKDNGFDLIIEFPQTLTITPGIYTFGLSANEVPPAGAVGVGSYLSISKRFEVQVYSYDKYLGASFDAPSVNEGSSVNFQISVQSQTYSDIDSVRGYITVYDRGNKELAKLATPEIALKSLTSQTLDAVWNTTGLLPGDYWAKAFVSYDGKNINLNDTFKIGFMEVSVLNYSQELEQGFSEFKVQIVNKWGNTLNNVYARLFLEGQEVLQTPSISIGPWQEKNLQGIVNIEKEPGVYSGVLKLFFEGESKEEAITLAVLPQKKALQEEMAQTQRIARIFMVISGALVLILISYILYHKHKLSGKKGKDFI